MPGRFERYPRYLNVHNEYHVPACGFTRVCEGHVVGPPTIATARTHAVGRCRIEGVPPRRRIESDWSLNCP